MTRKTLGIIGIGPLSVEAPSPKFELARLEMLFKLPLPIVVVPLNGCENMSRRDWRWHNSWSRRHQRRRLLNSASSAAAKSSGADSNGSRDEGTNGQRTAYRILKS